MVGLFCTPISKQLKKDSNMYDKVENFHRLFDLRDKISDALYEVERIMKNEFPSEYQNAEVYWIAHIKSALGGYGYHTYSTTFLSALEVLEEEIYGREEDKEIDLEII